VSSSDAAFTALARQRCPVVGDVLLVMTGAFQRVDPDAMDARLDELARPLFDVPRAARPERLAEQLAGFAIDERSVSGLWLDEVVRLRRGHPMLVAAVGSELGRRAGLEAGVFSTPADWYAGVLERLACATGSPCGRRSTTPDSICSPRWAGRMTAGLAGRRPDD
jgi:hypothetical protein